MMTVIAKQPQTVLNMILDSQVLDGRQGRKGSIAPSRGAQQPQFMPAWALSCVRFLRHVSKSTTSAYVQLRRTAVVHQRQTAVQDAGRSFQKRPVSVAMALTSALLYGGAAVSMNFINKLTLQVISAAQAQMSSQSL